MSFGARLRGWFHRTGSESLGWVLVVLGIVMLIMPGPGLLALLGGVALLARHYTWADSILEPLEARAIEAAQYGVATVPRIVLSVLGVVFVCSVGVVWLISPAIPEFEVLGVGFGPELPGAGWFGAISIWASAAIALGLLVYSVRRWYPGRTKTP